MQKFNLNALESANMTVASEELLNDVNGGHHIILRRARYSGYSSCGGSYSSYGAWYVSESIKGKCQYNCPGAAPKYLLDNEYRLHNFGGLGGVTKMEFDVTQGSTNTMWNVSWANGGFAIVSSNGGWWQYQ